MTISDYNFIIADYVIQNEYFYLIYVSIWKFDNVAYYS